MGGSQTTETTFPDWINEPAKRAIRKGEEVGKVGYVPYAGPDVAAFTPMQNAAFRGTNEMAGAFGMPTGKNPMPRAQEYAGGIQGYGSYDLYNQSLAQLAQNDPGQFGLLNSFFYNPKYENQWKKKGGKGDKKKGIR